MMGSVETSVRTDEESFKTTTFSSCLAAFFPPKTEKVAEPQLQFKYRRPRILQFSCRSKAGVSIWRTRLLHKLLHKGSGNRSKDRSHSSERFSGKRLLFFFSFFSTLK